MAGRSHQFPHLENLRALWSKTGAAAPGVWMVVQTVISEQDKELSPDLERLMEWVAGPKVLRMWLLSISYRKPLVLNLENLKMWEQNWQRIQNLAALVILFPQADDTEISSELEQAVYDLKSALIKMLENDLAVYRFWPVLFELCRKVNKMQDKGRLRAAEAGLVLKHIRRMDDILEIIDWNRMPLPEAEWPKKLAVLIRERDLAKTQKNYSRADSLRTEIRNLGYRVVDTRTGTRLYHQEDGEEAGQGGEVRS